MGYDTLKAFVCINFLFTVSAGKRKSLPFLLSVMFGDVETL